MELLDADAGRYLLDHRVAEAVRYGRPFAIVRLRLPAEEIAAAVPELLEVLRHADALARWADDELLAVLPETDREGAARAAERLSAAVAHIPVLAGPAHWAGDTAPDLLGRAAWAAARVA